MAPPQTGTTTTFGRRNPTVGAINATFSPKAGMTVFAGLRADPFFFDVERLYQIFPDRMTPLSGQVQDTPMPNAPQKMGFRASRPAPPATTRRRPATSSPT